MNYFNTNTEDIDLLKTTREIAVKALNQVTDEKVKEKIQEDLWDLNDAIERIEPSETKNENKQEQENEE